MLPLSGCHIYPYDDIELDKGTEAVGAARKMCVGYVCLSMDIPVTGSFAYKGMKLKVFGMHTSTWFYSDFRSLWM